MDDDLDSPRALAGIFDLVSRANAAADEEDASAEILARSVLRELEALGIYLPLSAETAIDELSASLMQRRDAARAAKDWAGADSLRGELEALGWVVEDSAEGTKVRPA